jgi:hypothetical protein
MPTKRCNSTYFRDPAEQPQEEIGHARKKFSGWWQYLGEFRNSPSRDSEPGFEPTWML